MDNRKYKVYRATENIKDKRKYQQQIEKEILGINKIREYRAFDLIENAT